MRLCGLHNIRFPIDTVWKQPLLYGFFVSKTIKMSPYVTQHRLGQGDSITVESLQALHAKRTGDVF